MVACHRSEEFLAVLDLVSERIEPGTQVHVILDIVSSLISAEAQARRFQLARRVHRGERRLNREHHNSNDDAYPFRRSKAPKSSRRHGERDTGSCRNRHRKRESKRLMRLRCRMSARCHRDPVLFDGDSDGVQPAEEVTPAQDTLRSLDADGMLKEADLGCQLTSPGGPARGPCAS